jgi:hypothetical protein
MENTNSSIFVSEKIVFYETGYGKVTIDIFYASETFWLTQKAIAELFNVKTPAISKHLKNIYDTEELSRDATVSKMETVQREGKRNIKR